jgi:hypothetical protein
MTELEGNSNLRPNGKRRWKPRKGLTNPAERMEELREQEDRNANEALTSGERRPKPKVITQRDIPLDAADRVDDKLRGEPEQ